ncbi:sulfatase family protein [Humisphaera borealis]|uniref:Sulfatase-like hydrolase/transferase n=1 Tax=Humisphaera borealis TaxID=2807512 RepID=A0A7M2X0D9_9BACT|nr:sulfatase [Humisphaera borealis]QOV90210.1 sulfatase-like hydrolase/transferase [Humisphaera borealis]
MSLQAAEANRPNVVIIFIDDLGYGDIGPYGATKQKTPNLDRMAREGMKLTSFYAAPVCSVSRAQLLTGCYGARVSVPAVYSPGGANGLNPAEHTIAERLKEQGYATICIGKWHVGDQPEFLPTRQGFDHYLGIPYSNDMQKVATATGQRVVPLVRDDKVEELLTDEAQSRIVEKYTTEAVGFIRTNKDKPFLLYLPHTAVHTPIHAGEKFRGKSANGRFGDWVEEVDWSVGQVLDTLTELKLQERTLVVFTSDNGPWAIKGPDGGSSGPLRGSKGSTWEGGVRVPTIAWWPGRIAAGTTCDAVAGTIDLLPTAVALAGGKLPAEPVIDGRDLSPLLFGKSTESQREAHYYFSGYNLQAVRQGPWKLAFAVQPEIKGQAAATDVVDGKPRLYNLDQEIGEKTNLADKHPDVVAKLAALAEKMKSELGGTSPTARRPPGVAAKPTTLYPTENAKPTAKPGKNNKPPAAGKPQSLDTARIGDVIPSANAPAIGGKPFTISCTVDTMQRDAVIVAHGGLSVGYALHIKDGKVAFVVRTSRDGVTEIVSRDAFTGTATITASLGADGAMKLTVNDEPPVTGKAAGLLPNHPAEDFSIGHDAGRPVGSYTAKEALKGTVRNLKIAVE